MLVRPVHHEWEMWKWAAMISLAAALSLLFASAVGATDLLNGKPQLLPSEIQDWAQPMHAGAGPGAAHVSGVAVTPAEADAVVDVGREIWRALALHRARKHDDAINVWTERLPPGSGVVDVWKSIALSQAFIATDRLEDAETLLARLVDAYPENAVVYYFRGVLRMQQARLAEEWPDVIGSKRTRLVHFASPFAAPRRVVPNTRAMYELAASVELEKAIEFSSGVHLDELIVVRGQVGGAALEPTVGDLLLAVGAEKFEAKAHNALSYLFLERGALEVAEQHMDQAISNGLTVVYGYRDLGDEYRARGQHQDAARAYLKATKFSSNKLGSILDAWRSLQDSFLKQ